jgi:DNA-binding XRE family transcriptional regulator
MLEGVASLDEALSRARIRRNLPDPRTRRALRVANGLTQATIAKELDVARPQVSRYESGKRTPRAEVAERYAALLDRLLQEIA